MSHRLVRTLCLVVLCLAAAVPVGAQGIFGPCSGERLAGNWGYTITGTLLVPGTGPVPVAMVGYHVADSSGNLVARQHTSLGGSVMEEQLTGTISVNPDCTGTMTMEIRNMSGQVLRTAAWAVVFDDNQSEARALLTSLTLPNGTPVAGIVTASARKMFANPVGR